MELRNFFPQKEELALIVVDIQDNLLKAFKEEIRDKVIQKSSTIIRYFKHKNYPIIVLEQYPKGIGPTNAEIKEALGDSYLPIIKNCFSGVCADGFEEKLTNLNKRDIVLIGIEAHICVLQTCYDLILRGKKVYLPADAVGSRFKVDWNYGLRAMENMGANILTTEILIFKLLERAGTEDFKFMLPYLK